MSNLKSCSVSIKSNVNTLNLSDYPHLPNTDLFRFLKELPPLDSTGPWVAGGSVWRSINNEPLDNCDIDIFFQNKEQYEAGCRRMNSLPFVNHIINETKHKYNTVYKFHVSKGKTYNKTIDVQLMRTDLHPSLDQLLESFDFSVCQFGYDGKNLFMVNGALDDLSKKKLVVRRISRPKSMVKHMLKYMDNGFTISDNQIKYLLNQFVDNDIWKKFDNDDYDECKKASTCVEASYDSNWAGFRGAVRRNVGDRHAVGERNLREPGFRQQEAANIWNNPVVGFVGNDAWADAPAAIQAQPAVPIVNPDPAIIQNEYRIDNEVGFGFGGPVPPAAVPPIAMAEPINQVDYRDIVYNGMVYQPNPEVVPLVPQPQNIAVNANLQQNAINLGIEMDHQIDELINELENEGENEDDGRLDAEERLEMVDQAHAERQVLNQAYGRFFGNAPRNAPRADIPQPQENDDDQAIRDDEVIRNIFANRAERIENNGGGVDWEGYAPHRRPNNG